MDPNPFNTCNFFQTPSTFVAVTGGFLDGILELLEHCLSQVGVDKQIDISSILFKQL